MTAAATANQDPRPGTRSQIIGLTSPFQCGFATPLVVAVVPLSNRSDAEAYHHRYFENHPSQGYCAMVVAPKLSKFRKVHAELRRK